MKGNVFFFYVVTSLYFSPLLLSSAYLFQLPSSHNIFKNKSSQHFFGRLRIQSKWELDSLHNIHPSCVFSPPWLQHNVLKRYRLLCIGQRVHLFHVQPLSMCPCPSSDPALGCVALQHFVHRLLSCLWILGSHKCRKDEEIFCFQLRLNRLCLESPVNWAGINLFFWFPGCLRPLHLFLLW